MNARSWVASIYVVTGSLIIIFCACLIKDKLHLPEGLIGKILLTASGLVWLSFGILDSDPTIDLIIHMLLIRLIVFLTSSFIGLILLSVGYHRIAQDKFLKWYTLSSAGLILLLSFLSVFVYNDASWIRINASLTIYFVWFIVFGLRNLVSEQLQREP
jgi:hypothetical protein